MEIPFVNIHTHREVEDGVMAIKNVLPSYATNHSLHISVGVHPWFISAERIDQDIKWVRLWAEKAEVLAIGECGLDRKCSTPWEIQKRVFIEHLDMATEVNKPLIIHCVRAQQEVLRELKQVKVPFLFHGFNRGIEMAMEIINEGGYIGLSSAILNKLEAVHWVREIPLNKVLLETDDLSISIQEVYRQFANVVDVELEELKWKLYQNTMSLGINWNKNERC